MVTILRKHTLVWIELERVIIFCSSGIKVYKFLDYNCKCSMRTGGQRGHEILKIYFPIENDTMELLIFQKHSPIFSTILGEKK